MKKAHNHKLTVVESRSGGPGLVAALDQLSKEGWQPIAVLNRTHDSGWNIISKQPTEIPQVYNFDFDLTPEQAMKLMNFLANHRLNGVHLSFHGTAIGTAFHAVDKVTEEKVDLSDYENW